MNILIFGCAGFIGINLTKYFLKKKHNVIGVDNLTYASNIKEIYKLKKNNNFKFYKLNINSKDILKVIQMNKPTWIINMAAESHVDNSIVKPTKFIKTNINGVLNILLNCLIYYKKISNFKKRKFRFLQVSTDEVYGNIVRGNVDEKTKYNPSSPYSASKAAADHLVNSWNLTYNLPTLITYCSNNFGPFQHKEKFIPKIIFCLKNSKKIPIYGKGKNKREWIFVEDHIQAIEKVLKKGQIGSSYNIGSTVNLSNIQLLNIIFKKIKKLKLINNNTKIDKFVKFTTDRPGHDFRYSLNSNKIRKELKWVETNTFDKSLIKTIKWYYSEKI